MDGWIRYRNPNTLKGFLSETLRITEGGLQFKIITPSWTVKGVVSECEARIEGKNRVIEVKLSKFYRLGPKFDSNGFRQTIWREEPNSINGFPCSIRIVYRNFYFQRRSPKQDDTIKVFTLDGETCYIYGRNDPENLTEHLGQITTIAEYQKRLVRTDQP